jgi:hypothetical protein
MLFLVFLRKLVCSLQKFPESEHVTIQLRRKNPGRIGTVVNDRLRRKTGIYGGRTRTPHTGTVYDVKQSETDSVYGDRVKIRSD